MKIFLKLKKWSVESSGASWLMGGLVIIILVSFYRETQIEKMAKGQLQEIVSVIQNADHNMQETKKMMQDKNKKIDSAFEASAKKNEENKDEAANEIHETQKAISDMVNKNLFPNKPIKDPIISEKGPHTIEDVKVMRLALEATLNKLITLRTEDELEEYVKLQKDFENLLIEVFADKDEDKEQA
jgi:hypothetical protein